MEREPGTIVIDFEGGRGGGGRRGGDGGPREEDELVDDDFKALVNEFGVADEEEEEMAPETREAKVEAEAAGGPRADRGDAPDKDGRFGRCRRRG